MAQRWDVLEEHTSRIYEEGGVITVKIDAVGIGRQDAVRLAQHLLEAAGASVLEAVAAIGSITFEKPGEHE